MPRPAPTPPRLRVTTREVTAIEDVLEHAAPENPTVWSRRADVMVGHGCTADLSAQASRPGDTGRGQADEAARWWRELAARAEVDDPVGLPGTGLIAFGALPFDASSQRPGRLTVPRHVVGRRGGRSWVTTIAVIDEADSHDAPSAPATTAPSAADGSGIPPRTPYGPHWSATLGPGALTPEGYQRAVRAGLAAIAAGEVGKVVLARDLVGSIPSGADLRRLVRTLASEYPDTWTYAVDGIIGASPETLVTVSGGTVTARVLAGTIARGADADADTAASVALATSAKDLDEHEYAVQSVLAALRPHTGALAAGEQPFMLRLPNVWHLATDVEGTLRDRSSALDLVGALHPTAAVAGTPTDAAIGVIRSLEPFDRGRYAGPVGWIGAHGDGEWAIALRCAQVDLGTASAGTSDRIPLVAHAGAGIVAGSDPEAELLETRVKFRPIVDALA
ncbi:isochorismate synthase [Microbacterium sp.]|uniref:isochorismate synthase n=1 Tax=Microbacterium sp. TaxID=51671 RepID=UPI0039E37522